MSVLSHLWRQTGKSLAQTWPSQLLTAISIGLAVLFFAFFALVYQNLRDAALRLQEEIQLVVYFEAELPAEVQERLAAEIQGWGGVARVAYVSSAEAFGRLATRLGPEEDILADLDPAFLPPALEVYPQRTLEALARLPDLAAKLSQLPGSIRVQEGYDWVDRLKRVVSLVRLVLVASGVLLVVTAVFIVSSTIRLAALRRQEEIAILRLLGASASYVQGPFLLEALLQGLLGAGCGMALLYAGFQWLLAQVTGQGLLRFLDLHFFPLGLAAGFVVAIAGLCTLGSLWAVRASLRL
ncbi:MAG: permease-like cell division protein FtsX [Thermodesulfobacteriota bacterium]